METPAETEESKSQRLTGPRALVQDLIGLSITIAACFFVLAGAGIVTIWFWLKLF